MTVRTIEHLIAGGTAGGPSSGDGRSGDVFDPNSGEIQARVEALRQHQDNLEHEVEARDTNENAFMAPLFASYKRAM